MSISNEQAIYLLKGMRGKAIQSEAEALDMAIEALQQGCEKVAEGCDDLISRSDAVNAIYHHLTGWTMDECRMMLHEVPSAQPEIIRCENCRRRDDKWEDWEEGKVYWCDIMDGCVKADDYCSYAERRTDG